MSCAHHQAVAAGCDGAFTVDASRVTFGRGCLREVGDRVRALGVKRAALFTDERIQTLAIFETVKASLADAGVDIVTFADVRVEPTDESLARAIRFAQEAKPDGYVSLGGGSVIDTCKVANLFARHPTDLLTFVNAPVGEGRPVPSALFPHVACPTTSGTGSEVTGIAIFDLISLAAKTGIASPMLRPSEALIDADCTDSLPSEVVAASGFDVLSHALESYTARPHTMRKAPPRPTARPMSQGQNPWSDLGCREALRLLGLFLARAVHDKEDGEAREQVMWAATLAGIAFGNAGVHVPHAMSYAVAGLVREFRPSGYPQDEPIVPHGMSVILNAPAVFRHFAESSPARHIEAASWLGADVRGAREADAGEVVATQLVSLMRTLGMPNGLAGVGYGDADVDALVRGTLPQQRLLVNAPRECLDVTLASLFRGALITGEGKKVTHDASAIDSKDSKKSAFAWFTDLTTRWMDNDVYGHVNNVTYYSYFDSAANLYLISEGGLDIQTGTVIGVVVESRCVYREPVAYPERLTAGLRVDKLGNRSVTYGIGIFKEGRDVAAAHGHSVHVFVDRETRKPVAIPERIRVALERIARVPAIL